MKNYACNYWLNFRILNSSSVYSGSSSVSYLTSVTFSSVFACTDCPMRSSSCSNFRLFRNAIPHRATVRLIHCSLYKLYLTLLAGTTCSHEVLRRLWLIQFQHEHGILTGSDVEMDQLAKIADKLMGTRGPLTYSSVCASACGMPFDCRYANARSRHYKKMRVTIGTICGLERTCTRCDKWSRDTTLYFTRG